MAGVLARTQATAGKAPALSRLHQLNRDHDGHRAPRLSQCEAIMRAPVGCPCGQNQRL